MKILRGGRQDGARLLLVLAMVVIALLQGSGHIAHAGLPARYGNEASTLLGIEQAIGRFYYGAEGSVMSAFVFRFDGASSAVAGLDALDPGYDHADWDQYRITVDTLGPQTRAYHSVIFDSPSTELLTQVDASIYVVTVDAYDPELDTVTLATETITVMLAADDGDGPGTYQVDGTSTGGPWDTLPPGDGQSPAGFWVEYDDQFYPELPETTESEPDPDAFDFTVLEGIQRAVTRSYRGDMSLLASPETAPATTYGLAALVGEFETADHAAVALETLHAEGQAVFTDDLPITMERVNVGDIGDQTVADFGTLAEDGVTYELALVIVKKGPYLYATVALGIGTDTGVMETATAVLEAMIGAEAGSGEGMVNTAGDSTGGLWDTLPAVGDSVLNGLVPEEDEQVYP